MKYISSVQEAIWLTQNIYTESSLYNVGGYALLEGELDPQLLIRSIETVLGNSDTLTTGYHAFNDISLEDNGVFNLYEISSVDFSDTPGPDQSCLEWMNADVGEQLDVSRQLLKIKLLKSNNNRHYWYTKVHHLVFDGYSMALFFKNVAALYSLSLKDEAVQPIENTYLYSDFIREDKSYRLSDEFQKDKEFWLKRLTGIPASTAFQSCMNSSYRESLSSGRREFTVPRELYDQITLFCESYHCTPFHYFLTALLILNYRYNNPSPVIGIPVFNRRNKKFKNTLGTFVNILPFSVQVREDYLFTDLLKIVREELKDCYKHQRFSLYDLLDELDREGNIYTISFSYQKNTYETNLGNLTASITYLHSGQQQENLAFHLLEYSESGDLILSVDYKKDLFEKDVIDGLLTHFHNLLRTLLLSPDLPLRQLECLDEKEKHLLISTFNDTQTAYSHNTTLVELFEEQVRLTPDHKAIWFAGSSLDFRELNQLSNQLGNYLKHNFNIQAGDLVAIKLQRSQWLVIAILGTLKSGAAYVPVDPEYPQERIDYILSDSKCSLLIDEEGLRRFVKEKDKYDPENHPPIAQPDDLAYVIYTSGSSGQPKGCLLQHRGVVNRLEWMWRQFAYDTSDVILQKTSFTFDVSVWELFLPICFGAKMVMCTKEEAGSPQRILSLIEQQHITCLHFVPGMLTAFLTSLFEEDLRQRMRSLRLVITSGEALLPETVRSWYIKLDTPIHNLYGPTEASIDVTWFTTSPHDTLIPIGRPIWNTKLYIIGHSGQLLPVRTMGEICIAGIGLARGYLNKPELSAEKFVPDPFAAGSRMYRTGDIGRWLPDGNIEYIGRNDDQVKIRGYRIEIGEIENVLQGHPDIDIAVVVAREREKGEKELVAYLVCNKPLTTAQLNSFAGKTLPAYMLPGLYITVPSLPFTSSGKVDRKKLPDPAGLDIAGAADYIAPRNKIEEELVAIWKDILHREQIGVKNDFFASGGHSLKATRLASRIHKTFDVKLELSRLFRTTILEDQARLIQQSARELYTRIPTISPQPDYPLSSSQRRLWVLSQFKGGDIAYYMPGAYQLEGSLDSLRLQHCFNMVIARHEILRTVFKDGENGEPRQFINPPEQSEFRIDCYDLRKEEGQQRQLHKLITDSFSLPFNLAVGPLLRAGLYQVSDDKWVFAFIMHHIISDGWSIGILIKELLQLYNAAAGDPTDILPPLAIQYKDYSSWQQEQLATEKLAGHKKYWMNKFGGEQPVLQLPVDKPRPAFRTYEGQTVREMIPDPQMDGLGDFCLQQESSLFMGLLATLNILLFKYTGQKDMVIGSPIAGRQHLDLEGQIGFYVNTLALRTQFQESNSFRELLGLVKESALDAYKSQEYPFDLLVDQLDLQRDTGRNALFDVMIVLENEGNDPVEAMKFGDMAVSRYEVNETTSKFDLTFHFARLAEGWRMSIEFNTDIYLKDTITRMMGHFRMLLDDLLRQPDVPIDQLEYISPAEKRQLLKEFNDTAIPYPEDKTVIELFEQQVAATPDNIALLFEDIKLTYRELNEQTNQLGDYLRKNYHVRPDEPIAIKLERSEWLIIAILGILKAGGAYVPVDPEYPQERIDHMRRDSNCKVLIDEDELFVFRNGREKYQKENLPLVNKPADLLYVIYTSGSTGQPKGAMVKHHSFVNLALWYGRLLTLTEQDCILLMAPVSFDLAQKNIFTTLISGARLCLPAKLYGDYRLLAETIAQKGVTIVNAAPSAFYPLLDTSVNDRFKKLISLKKIVLGGEPIVIKEFKPWLTSGLYGAQVINSYGPTECTDVVSSYTVDNTEWNTLEDIPIGVPVDNNRIYILDDHHGLLPIGVAGEIFIAGTGVGRGYLNHPELTKEKFLPDPFHKGEKMYRTGDLGKWLMDGNIRYLGRKDNQVKIRGFRIELGEIENALQRHPGIAAAAVVSRSRRAGEQELLAYTVSREEMDVVEVRRYLSGILPGYMLPDHIIQMEKLPLTPSGKLDRRQLPQPEETESTGKEGYIPPRNATEEKMTLIWQEILGKEKVGVQDNFFRLGGHSLKAVQLISRINQTFLVRINVQNLFNDPTIENICGHIDFVAEQQKMKMNKGNMMQIEI